MSESVGERDWTEAGDGDCPAWLRRTESVAWRALQATLVLVGLFGLAAIWLLTLGYDEAWILQGISDAIFPRAPDLAVEPVLTTGGLSALSSAALTYLFGSTLWPKRLVSLLCGLGITALVWRWGRLRFGGTQAGALATAGLVATPGIVVLAGSAYGTLPAFLLAALGVSLLAPPEPSRTRVAVAGLLTGLATATRFEFAAVWPALLVVAAFAGPRRRPALLRAVVVSALGGLTLAVSLFLYARIGQVDVAARDAANSSGVAAGRTLDYPFMLNKLVVAQSFLPLLLAVAATTLGLGWAARKPRPHATALPSVGVLLSFGWLAWALWFLRAPQPHLRYLWPAAAAFFITVGLCLAALYQQGETQRRPAQRVLALVLGLACTVTGLVGGFRQLVHGEYNLMSWEWAGQAPLTYFTRFRHVGYQRRAARYLHDHVAPDERVLALGLDRQLGYLAERNVVEIPQLLARGTWSPSALPRRALLGPLTGNYLALGDEARHWIESNCVLEAQFGPYVFYRVTGTYPASPSMFLPTTTLYPGHPLAAAFK